MEPITRRRVLEATGAVLAGAAAATLADGLIPIAGRVRAEDQPQPLRLRRWVMVFDLQRCDGCVGLGLPPQCTQSCNWSRFVPEGQQWLEVYETDVTELPDASTQFLPALCMQCQNAPCTNVCPVGATFHTPEGVVLIDQERCIGCRLCMAACPYDRRFFNWDEPQQLPQVKSTPYNVQTQTPAIKGTVMKCDFCTDRAEAGGLPYCVEGCPREAIYYGDIEEDIASNGHEVVQLSRLLNQNEAFRYKEELGTKPRVYYIQGHGEQAQPRRMTEHERTFMKDRLEWPWERIAAEVAKLNPEKPA